MTEDYVKPIPNNTGKKYKNRTGDIGTRGRQTKLNDRIAGYINYLALKGKTDEQICDAIGITRQTLDNWREKESHLFDTIAGCKDTVDDMVEASLLQKAMGYQRKGSRSLMSPDGKIVKAPYTENIEPDVRAQQFWLKNRRRKEWKDRHTTELEPGDGLSQFTLTYGKPDEEKKDGESKDDRGQGPKQGPGSGTKSEN